jgi:two-component system CheB/CheR fusion protein
VKRLQQELTATREYMQSLVEQQEADNEELKSSSEEIQSSNEKLQSINEELETAKEELESSNEELATLNDELHNRNLELTLLNDDLNNLHVSVNIPILMLGHDLRIRRFTSQAEKVLSLISTDVGRPIGDIKLKIDVPDLEELIVEVISTVSAKEREARDKDGRWYLMRVRPYKTLDNRIDGAVIMPVDIDELKRSEAAIRESRDYAEAIVRTTRDPLLILNADLRVHAANEAFYTVFKISSAECEGRLIYELCNRQWDIPRLRELLENILPRNSFFNDFEVRLDVENIGQRTMLINARRLSGASQPARILLGIQDVTELLRFQAEMRRSEIRYRRLFEAAGDGVLLIDPKTRKILNANPFMTEPLGYRGDELRSPLNAMLGWVHRRFQTRIERNDVESSSASLCAAAVRAKHSSAPMSATVVSFCASQTSPCVPRYAAPSSGLTICATHDSSNSNMTLHASTIWGVRNKIHPWLALTARSSVSRIG